MAGDGAKLYATLHQRTIQYDKDSADIADRSTDGSQRRWGRARSVYSSTRSHTQLGGCTGSRLPCSALTYCYSRH